MSSKDLMKGALVGAVTASVVMISATALAGTGIGGVFNLGRKNSVNAQSTLTGATRGNSLRLANTGSGSALGLSVRAGKAPLVVNARAGKATNLNADKLDGLDSRQFVQGGGRDVAGRATLFLGGGGLQPIVSVPGWGEVVGGCGSGGAAVGFLNHSHHDLRAYAFAGADQTPVTFSDGTSSGLFPSGVGSAGVTTIQIGSTDFTDQHLLTVIATRDALASGKCAVQAWAITR